MPRRAGTARRPAVNLLSLRSTTKELSGHARRSAQEETGLAGAGSFRAELRHSRTASTSPLGRVTVSRTRGEDLLTCRGQEFPEKAAPCSLSGAALLPPTARCVTQLGPAYRAVLQVAVMVSCVPSKQMYF
ncbi:hypothetical protein MRX96_023234 [Rhipicephalus microplus]